MRNLSTAIIFLPSARNKFLSRSIIRISKKIFFQIKKVLIFLILCFWQQNDWDRPGIFHSILLAMPLERLGGTKCFGLRSQNVLVPLSLWPNMKD